MKFIYDGKEFDSEHIKHLFEQKSDLTNKEIADVIAIIEKEANLQKANSILVKEADEKLEFEIEKEKHLD